MERRLLVCDLDNTLYDWVGYFVPAFYAMIDKVVEITGCDRQSLLDDFRKVHQAWGDSEQPFALLETDTIRKAYAHSSQTEIIQALDPAFHAFNSVRKRNLKLYPDVRESLDRLAEANVKLVAHTESKLFGVVDRLRRLELSHYFARIYCRERPKLEQPAPKRIEGWFQGFPIDKVIELSNHQAKPNPTVLLEICSDEGISPHQSVYVGDSIAKDVLMAKQAGVFAIWARYGSEHDPALYEALVRVSHWTPQEVARERLLRIEAKGVEPDHIAYDSFAEVLPVFGIR